MKPHNYIKEKCFIAKTLGIKVKRIEIDSEHPSGFITIFIDGRYNGYIDEMFYGFMEYGVDTYGVFEDWLEDWNNINANSTSSARKHHIESTSA